MEHRVTPDLSSPHTDGARFQKKTSQSEISEEDFSERDFRRRLHRARFQKETSQSEISEGDFSERDFRRRLLRRDQAGGKEQAFISPSGPFSKLLPDWNYFSPTTSRRAGWVSDIRRDQSHCMIQQPLSLSLSFSLSLNTQLKEGSLTHSNSTHKNTFLCVFAHRRVNCVCVCVCVWLCVCAHFAAVGLLSGVCRGGVFRK